MSEFNHHTGMKLKLPYSWLVISMMVTAAGYAICQTNDISTNLPSLIPGDVSGKIVAFRKLISPWEFVLVPLVTGVVQALKNLIPKIPATVWPWVAPALGALFDWLAIEAGWWTGNPLVGTVLGSTGTWLYTIAKPTGLLKSSDDLAKPVVVAGPNPS
jgi:hypothetical protein